jgi:hypothetical protein
MLLTIPSRRPVLVSQFTLERAVKQVRRELRVLGLWDERMARVPVRRVLFGIYYGWQWYGSGSDICLPWLSLNRLSDYWAGEYKPVLDIVRHEYGHAFADTHRSLIRSRRFREAFGTAHSDERSHEYDERVHFTEYSATNASEDFAEVFMLYVRHRGRLPRQHRTRAKRAKWRLMRRLCTAVPI